MGLHLSHRITAFAQLGDRLRHLAPYDFSQLAEKAQLENPWFTPENVQRALTGISRFMEHDKLTAWAGSYRVAQNKPLTIAVIMAGNIPLVGFHDLLCVLISGHRALVKYSNKDRALLTTMVQWLIEIEPSFHDFITLTDNTIKDFDAVIATGSDNSARYFQYYFGKYPHIIRKNRVSVAVLSGRESHTELENLGEDVFAYFGLGCRNVAKIYLPEGYDIYQLHKPWKRFESIILHHKYANNYDYNKSIFLVNRQPFTDFGFVLLRETKELVSPVAVVHVEYYRLADEVKKDLLQHAPKIQCIVGNMPDAIPFGQAQYPEVHHYADGIDTMAFLQGLST